MFFIPSPVNAFVLITSYPIFEYSFSISSDMLSSKSILFITIIGLMLRYSAKTNCLSNINKSGLGNFVEITSVRFATFGLLEKFFRLTIFSIIAFLFSLSMISISTLSPTVGVISSFFNFPLAVAS